MADSNIIITSTSPQGKVLQKTLTDINPDATNAQLATFGTMLNALTDNQYGKTVKITKVHCDVEAGGGDTRPVPTLELWKRDKTEQIYETSKQTNAQEQGEFLTIKYDGDAQLLFGADAGNYVKVEGDFVDDLAAVIFIIKANTPAGTDAIFEIVAPATDNYQAASATLTVHITN